MTSKDLAQRFIEARDLRFQAENFPTIKVTPKEKDDPDEFGDTWLKVETKTKNKEGRTYIRNLTVLERASTEIVDHAIKNLLNSYYDFFTF